MAVQNFGRRLAKEFQRGGKKSLALALLLLVGLCVWIPMIWRTVWKKQDRLTSTSTSDRAVPAKDNAGLVNESRPVGTTTQAKDDWKLLYRGLEQSVVVQPIALDELVRDPFDHEWIRERKAQAAKPKVEPQVESDPIGSLVLTATLAGGEGGAAVISDVVYRIGQQVPKRGPVQYVLKDIRPDRVLLERAGNIHVLQLKDQAAREGPR